MNDTEVEKIEAYWFTSSDRLPHGDNRQIVLGETHSLDGEIIICRHALHASRDPFDALEYAPGPFLYRVLCWGDVVEQHDKLGGHHREYVAMRDSTSILRRFAREQALSVIHLWKPPDVVLRYLETGDETIRDAARAATRDRNWHTTSHVAGYAAMCAAWNAAAPSPAGGGAKDAARDAAWAAAWNAAKDARNVAWDAAGRAVEAAARKRFGELVAELFDGSTGQ